MNYLKIFCLKPFRITIKKLPSFQPSFFAHNEETDMRCSVNYFSFGGLSEILKLNQIEIQFTIDKHF